MLSRYQISRWNLCTKSPGKHIRLLENMPLLLSRVIHSSAIIGNQDPCCTPCCPPKTKSPCGGSSAGGSKGKVTYKKYIAPPKEDHDAKNMRIGRPMSPHLTIFGPTVPSVTSILQRITGVMLTFYAFLLSGGTLFLSNGIETYVSMIQSLDLNSFSIFVLKLCLGAPFSFHYFNAIRFIGWNMGKFYTLKEAYVSAKYAIIAACVVNVLFALC